VQADVVESIPDFSTPSRTVAPRATPAQPTVTRSQSKAPRQLAVHLTGHSASGTATWYCKPGVSVCHNAYPGGLYAAAGPELRVGDWRGRAVRVCGNGRCVNVRLIDWCACGGNHIIDLYSDAFTRLAPLSAGGIRVRVSW
jgi:rare lipoprotein A (peptidoglycan hydrolase)